jgi:tRNA nucleotidyltransferase/poly(A) polymerase
MEVKLLLTQKEKDLFDLLLSVVKDSNLNTTLRVAGGWVRDKLISRDSHDLDIALDDQSGEDFARLVKAYLERQGVATRKVAVIQVQFFRF